MTKAQTLMSISILLPVKIVSSDSVMDLAAVELRLVLASWSLLGQILKGMIMVHFYARLKKETLEDL